LFAHETRGAVTIQMRRAG